MVEHGAAQIARYPLAQPGDEVEAQCGGGTERCDDEEHGQSRAVQAGRAGAAETLIDELAQALAEAQQQARRHQQRQGGGDGPAEIGPQMRQQHAQRGERRAGHAKLLGTGPS